MTKGEIYAGYVDLIRQLDGTIETTRAIWGDSKNESEKRHWSSRIDQLLDERFRLMKLRDKNKPNERKKEVSRN